MNSVIFKNLGIIKFKEAWELQEALLKSIIDVKKENRNSPEKKNKNKKLFIIL